MKRLALLFLATAALAPAYYHFVRYQSRTAPYVPIYDRFDVASLPNRTVPFLISENGPSQLAAGDTTAAVISQIRAAARVWSSVETSELKLAFGGLYAPGTSMAGPWIEVEFTDELPPGILAQGGPVTRLEPIQGTSGNTFVPISKSLLRLPRNLSARASWSERFFLTVVHEFGHTLGLQHSWASGAMSTEITRATSKARPLTSDDVAGISVLYPAAGFPASYGSISGRVSSAGSGVALASVVALAPNRPAISALTHPDGSYRIEGVPAGQYFVVAHPLPPSLAGEPTPVNLELPSDPGGKIVPNQLFDTTFYPGTSLPQQAVGVAEGEMIENVNFNVNRRDRINLYSAQTYSFLGQEAIKPATLTLGAQKGTMVFTGYGMTAPLAGLSMSLISAPETAGALRTYSSGYLQSDIALSPVSAEGARHLLFSYNGENYLLPSGLNVMQRTAPSLNSVTSNADRSLSLQGASLGSTTQIWVDGVVARVKTAQDGQLTVVPPPAPSGYRGVLAAFNTDGQSSLFVHGANSPAYTQEGEAPTTSLSTLALPAGSESVIEISGTGGDFTLWPPVVGFGSSDVVVRKIYSPGVDRALAVVAVSGAATPGATTLTVANGLVLSSTPGGFQILPNARTPYVAMSQLPATSIYPGLTVTLPVANAPVIAQLANISVTVGEKPAAVVSYLAGQLAVQIPTGLATGPAVVKITIEGLQVLPALLQIDPQPPIVLLAQTVIGTAIGPANPPRPGDTLQLVVSASSPSDSPAQPDVAHVKVSSGSLEHGVQSVLPNPAVPGTYLVQFSISLNSPNVTLLPLVVSIDGRSSSAFQLPYRP